MRKRYPSLQTEDYPIWQDELGNMFVGHKTLLCTFCPQSVIDLMTGSSYFHELHLISTIEHNDKEYRYHIFLRKNEYNHKYIMRVAVDTNGDFEYEFENL